MAQEAFALSPEEAGVILGESGNPTETGWKIVTPEAWKYRTTLIQDKALTPEGYTDKDTYMDCAKAKIMVDVFEANPNNTPSELMSMITEQYLDTQSIFIRPYELLAGNAANDSHGLLLDLLTDLAGYYDSFYGEGLGYYWENGEKKLVDPQLNDRIRAFLKRWSIAFGIKPMIDPMHYKMAFDPLIGHRFWEPAGTTGIRANPDHAWYLNAGLRELIRRMEGTIERLDNVSSCTTYRSDAKRQETWRSFVRRRD